MKNARPIIHRVGTSSRRRRFDDSTASMESWATRARDAVASRDGIALTACVSARAIVGGGARDDDFDGAEAIERRACARVRGLGGALEGSWDEALGAFYAAAVCGARASVIVICRRSDAMICRISRMRGSW